jgi:hypothetical protein
MSVIIDGSNGITTPLDVEIQGSTSGSIIVAAPAVAGSNTQTLVAATGTLAPLIAGTAVASTSGTSIDFTSIPSWVKRITVMFSGVSTSGTSNIQIQLGDSGGIENTGYVSTASTNGTSLAASTAGFITSGTTAAATTVNGWYAICLVNSNNWAGGGSLARADGNMNNAGGAKTLSDVLTQVRITTVNGTDTFDAGSINILYE